MEKTGRVVETGLNTLERRCIFVTNFKCSSKVCIMTISAKRFLSVGVLVIILALGAYTVSVYLHQSFHQASIKVGEHFPAMTVRAASVPDKPSTLPAGTKRIVVIVRNGCVFCDTLERNLEAVFARLPVQEQRLDSALFILSLDEAPHNSRTQALARNRYVYHGKENNLFFSQTPHTYVLDGNNIVLKKYIGVLDTATLRGMLHEHFAVSAVANK